MLCAARERSEHSNGCTSRKNRGPRYALRRDPRHVVRGIHEVGEPDYWHSPRAKRAYNGCAPEGGCLSLYNVYARVAELADAQDLKSCCSDTVPVRFRSRARFKAASNPCKSRVWSFFIMSCIIWSHICVANV